MIIAEKDLQLCAQTHLARLSAVRSKHMFYKRAYRHQGYDYL